MNISWQAKLDLLRADYAAVRGHPFAHFFCPVLFRDEDVVLSKAHVVNQAFPESARDWTIQRQDVDSFYGAFFEADFLAFQYQGTNGIVTNHPDKAFSKSFRPKILLNDEPVDYFFAKGDLPPNFTRLDIEHEGQVIQLGLKLPPEVVASSTQQKWEVAIEKDFRVPALVSLMKAAYLSLFHLVGYRYALSPGGYFIGHESLGRFFLENRTMAKATVLANAYAFFKEFANIVRPVQSNSLGFQGTITDKRVFVCGTPGKLVWAIVVFIKTANLLSAVLMPVLDQPDAVDTYLSFMKNKSENIQAYLGRYEQGQWQIQMQPYDFAWPKTGVLYP